MTDEITNVQSGYFTQERIQGDLNAENPLICSRFRVMYRRTERRDFP